ncbi:type VII secretion-associated serine protease mycosin [Tomitella gaofuii]|uniref:type VII secretion-associated serine protease mycosin n=1 Tax=Tomitella gaofuii TaxID=2760083 RepID=UPI0015FC7933|nr:type VII secretion-associated serine protease mycosin [Tomitella gaofuii]
MTPWRGALAAAVPVVLATLTAVASAAPATAEVRQTAPCAIADRAPGAPPIGVPPAQAGLHVADLWRFGTGQGQTVAVIDTGVAPHPRLRNLVPGGDLVAPGGRGAGPGLTDCDAHGTIVAGLIAAAPSPRDGFGGVAPDARILSIRQSSAKFTDSARASEAPDGGPDGQTGRGTGTIGTLARAIRMAADQGATVINISEVACGRGVGALRTSTLADAVAYAARHDIVIVAAAGNTRGDGGACRQNPTERDPLRPDSRGWDSAFTDVAPAHYTDHVLTVASVDPDGSPSEFSVAGPWVTVAAPGTGIVSLANSADGGLAGRVRTERGVTAIEGTSFAAPLVAGLAADIRSRFPALSATEVVERIVATAVPGPHGWEPTVGYGVIDPLAALTTTPAALRALRTGVDGPDGGPGGRTAALATAPAPETPDTAARDRALLAAAASAAALGAAGIGAGILRRARAHGAPGLTPR